jgi:DNA-binding FrmR family transcriptional regulator
MIENRRECEDIIIQLAAVCSAIEGVAGLILQNYMQICFRGETAPECIDIESLARAIASGARYMSASRPKLSADSSQSMLSGSYA